MFEIRMNGPGKNALGSAMMDFLLERLAAAAGAPVLLTGEGDTFCAGLNLKEVASLDPAGMERFLEKLERVACALYLHPGPTVALVNGHAIAGGCVLTLACDRRIVVQEPRIKIGLNEVALGLRFPPRIFAIARARVPARHSVEVLLGAGLFSPEEALRLGLVDVVTPDAAAVARAELERLAAHPPGAYARTKRDLRGADDTGLCGDAEWKQRIADMLPTWTSDETKRRALAALRR